MEDKIKDMYKMAEEATEALNKMAAEGSALIEKEAEEASQAMLKTIGEQPTRKELKAFKKKLYTDCKATCKSYELLGIEACMGCF